MTSLTSELTKWFHYIHALESHSQIFTGQQQRDTASACPVKLGDINRVAFKFVAFPLFFEIVSCKLPYQAVSSSGVFWVLWPGSVSALACGNMTNWPDRTKNELIISDEFAGSFIHKTGEAEWVENWDRYLLIVPLSLCSIPSANVYSPFMFLSRSPWGESAWVPQPQWVGGREEVQRVQNEELDPPGAPSYRLTCPNLTLLINIMPVSSPMQCDCDGQAKQGNSKYD